MKRPAEIRFSHRYFKLKEVMPERCFLSLVQKVENLHGIPPGFLWLDTQYKNGFYELDKDKPHLILLFYSPRVDGDGLLFTTIRPWRPDKEKYYTGMIGEKFRAIITETDGEEGICEDQQKNYTG